MCPSINDEVGVLVDGFDTPSVLMMPHNPRYYPALLEAAGLSKAKDVLAFQNTHTVLPERLIAAAEVLHRRYGVACRTIDMRRFPEEIALIQRLFNAGWERNWGYVPLTDAEVAYLARQLKPLVVPSSSCSPSARACRSASRRRCPTSTSRCERTRRAGCSRASSGCCGPRGGSRGCAAAAGGRAGVAGPRRRRAALPPHLGGRPAPGLRLGRGRLGPQDNVPMINGLLRMGFTPYKTYRIYERPV